MAVVQTLIGNIKGPQGEQGAQGVQGEQGDAATISVGSVTTVPYGTNASVVNSGTEKEAILDFRIPQGRPGEQVTQLDNLVLNSITEPSTEFPIPAIGDIGSVLFGKVSKWFSDMTALVATKLNAANVVNNLTTTASGYALDARQGKALADALTKEEYGEFTNNTYFATGLWQVRRQGGLVTMTWPGRTNAITSQEEYLTLFTLPADYRPRYAVLSLFKSFANANMVIRVNSTGVVDMYLPSSLDNTQQFRILMTWAVPFM